MTRAVADHRPSAGGCLGTATSSKFSAGRDGNGIYRRQTRAAILRRDYRHSTKWVLTTGYLPERMPGWSPIMPDTFIGRLNGERHELALRLFMVIVLAHWAEHLLQAVQIYALGWPVPES